MIKKLVYISTLEKVELLNGSEVKVYNPPIAYRFNVVEKKGETTSELYGKKIASTYRTVIPKSLYNGKFHRGDKVYLEGANPDSPVGKSVVGDRAFLDDEFKVDESYFGQYANYEISDIREGYNRIVLLFTRIQN